VVEEVAIQYGARPAGSYSKLNTLSDGIRVLIKIFDVLKAYRPMLFFSIIGFLTSFLGLLVGSVPVLEFVYTGKILHFPSAILATGIMIIAIVLFSIGVILDTLNHRLRELIYLRFSKD
jgi:hypothetical protein